MDGRLSSRIPALVANSANPTGILEVTANSGIEFFRKFAAWLRDELDVFAVTVGEVTHHGDRIGMIAQAYRDPAATPIDSYSIEGTPCLRVVYGGESICVANGARYAYPHDEIFTAESIEYYQGVPLYLGDRVIGLVCVFDDKASVLTHETIELLQWWAPRLSSELASALTTRYTASAAEWVALTGDALFEKIAAFICTALQVTSAFITEWADDDRNLFTMRGFFHRGSLRHEYDGMLIPRLGAPCERLDEADTVLIGTGLADAFPDIPFIQELGLDSYLGKVLRNREGMVLGHIAVMHQHPMSPAIANSAVLSIYANRAIAELEHRRLDKQRSAMESALVTSQKLESVGRMAGAIAHDYNNLLMTILGNANLAIDLLDADAPAREHVDRIQSAAARAGDIVANLLDYAGNKPEQRTLVDVNALVRASVGLISLADRPDVRVVCELADGELPVVAGETQLQQILLNLIINAAQAIERSGTVTVSTRRQVVDVAQTPGLVIGHELAEADVVVIEVTDDGVGIDETVLTRMFDPFYSNRLDGRGLGLAVVQGVVRSHGAALGVATEPGTGTTISVYFPAAESAARTPSSGDSDRGRALDLTGPVLLVDDEASVREVTRAILESVSIDVVDFANGEAAVAYLQSHPAPAAALIDVAMPGMDGWELLSILRQIYPSVPVVMLSGFTSAEVTDKLADQRGVSFLAKPFGVAALRSHLAGVVRDQDPDPT